MQRADMGTYIVFTAQEERHSKTTHTNTHKQKIQASATSRGDLRVQKHVIFVKAGKHYVYIVSEKFQELLPGAGYNSAYRERGTYLPRAAVTVHIVPALQQVWESVHVADAVRSTIRVSLARAAAKPNSTATHAKERARVLSWSPALDRRRWEGDTTVTQRRPLLSPPLQRKTKLRRGGRKVPRKKTAPVRARQNLEHLSNARACSGKYVNPRRLPWQPQVYHGLETVPIGKTGGRRSQISQSSNHVVVVPRRGHSSVTGAYYYQQHQQRQQ